MGTLPTGATITTRVPGSFAFAVNSLDNVGHAANISVPYNVTYKICMDYDANEAKPAGSVVPIRIQLCDAKNEEIAGPVVTAIEVTFADSTGSFPAISTGNQGTAFRLGGNTYPFNLTTKGLAPGAYDLVFSVSGDPVPHVAPLRLK